MLAFNSSFTAGLVIEYTISVGASAFIVVKSVIEYNFALIVPAFSTITVYSAYAPGFSNVTSNVATTLSSARLGVASASVAPDELASVILLNLTFHSELIPAVPLIVSVCDT